MTQDSKQNSKPQMQMRAVPLSADTMFFMVNYPSGIDAICAAMKQAAMELQPGKPGDRMGVTIVMTHAGDKGFTIQVGIEDDPPVNMIGKEDMH